MEISNDFKENVENDDPKPLKDALLGLTAINQNVVLLDYGYVVICRGYRHLNTVRFLSGGVAGTDLTHAIVVGKGMLTAAILGEKTAPTSRQILRTIKELHEGNQCGVFVIVQSNADLFNFGLAVERANVNCRMRVKLLSIDDDKSSSAVKERNSCGFILLSKILGAMAESGAIYDDIWQCYQEIVNLIFTIPLNYYDQEIVPQGHKIICLSMDFEAHVHHVIDKLLEGDVRPHPQIQTVVLMNISNKLERLAELALVKQVVDKLRRLGLCIVRLHIGHFVATAAGRGSLTIMKVCNNKIIDYLDAPCEALAWKNFQHLPEVTIENEIPGSLINQGKQLVPLNGPKLSENQSSILLKSVQFACDALISCERQLNIIDAEKSMGNVGTRFRTTAQHINKRLNHKKLPINCPYAFLKKLSVITETAIGGAMGSIYGILFESAANVFAEVPENELVTPVIWSKALSAATEVIKENCSHTMRSQTMYRPIKACEVTVSKEMERDKNFIECYGLGVTKAEEEAQKTRLSQCTYADAGAHAVGIWMRAVFEGVKLYCSD